MQPRLLSLVLLLSKSAGGLGSQSYPNISSCKLFLSSILQDLSHTERFDLFIEFLTCSCSCSCSCSSSSYDSLMGDRWEWFGSLCFLFFFGASCSSSLAVVLYVLESQSILLTYWLQSGFALLGGKVHLLKVRFISERDASLRRLSGLQLLYILANQGIMLNTSASTYGPCSLIRNDLTQYALSKMSSKSSLFWSSSKRLMWLAEELRSLKLQFECLSSHPRRAHYNKLSLRIEEAVLMTFPA